MGTAEDGLIPEILLVQFSDGDIEFTVEARDQWLQAAAFFFERFTPRELDLEG